MPDSTTGAPWWPDGWFPAGWHVDGWWGLVTVTAPGPPEDTVFVPFEERTYGISADLLTSLVPSEDRVAIITG